MMQIHSKLFVVTRRDISPGYQAVQAAHASIEFQHEHPQIAKEWNTNSKYLVFLTVENEEALQRLLEKIQIRDIKYSVFFEPDIGNQLTAVCLEPGQVSEKIVSNLPLALKEYSLTKI